MDLCADHPFPRRALPHLLTIYIDDIDDIENCMNSGNTNEFYLKGEGMQINPMSQLISTLILSPDCIWYLQAYHYPLFYCTKGINWKIINKKLLHESQPKVFVYHSEQCMKLQVILIWGTGKWSHETRTLAAHACAKPAMILLILQTC